LAHGGIFGGRVGVPLLKQNIRFCTSRDGTRIAYATMGQGPPLVRAAHTFTHLEFELNSPVWSPWLAELSRSNTLVRYDQRGCGLSDRDPDILVQAGESFVFDRKGLAIVSPLGHVTLSISAPAGAHVRIGADAPASPQGRFAVAPAAAA
jgi:pimeloyl-ACP methyl ester carboxylesterase